MLRRLSKDVAIYGGADLLFRLAQFVAIPVYAYALSVEDFGILALVTVSATLLGMLANLGVNSGVQRFFFEPGLAEADRPKIVSTGLAQLLISCAACTLVAFVVLLPLAPVIQAKYGIAWILIVLALLAVLPDQVAQFTLDAVRLQFKPWKFVAISLLKNLVGVLLGIWFLLAWDMGVAGLLLGALIGSVAAVPVGLAIISSNLTMKLDPSICAKVLRYGYPLVLTGAAYWIFGSMGRWMLAGMSDLVQVGLFSVAVRFAALITFVISAFAQAWSPFAFKLWSEDPEYRVHFARIFSLWFLLLALLALALALFSPELLRLLTPQTYWSAAPILGISAVGVALYGTIQFTALGIQLERRTMLLSLAAWMAAATNVVVNLALIPRLGGIGAAVATLASYLVLTGAFLFWSQRLHPIPLERSKLAYSLLLLALGAVASWMVAPLGVGVEATLLKVGILCGALAGAFVAGILAPSHYRWMFPASPAVR